MRRRALETTWQVRADAGCVGGSRVAPPAGAGLHSVARDPPVPATALCAAGLACDVSNPASVDAMMAAAMEQLGGRVDIVINNAGYSGSFQVGR